MEEEVIRVRMPRGNEMFGIIEEMLGSSRFRISCKDGKVRMCRIPGRFRKRLKVSVGDIVLVEPWIVESDEKADIVWIYNRTHASWLRKKGAV